MKRQKLPALLWLMVPLLAVLLMSAGPVEGPRWRVGLANIHQVFASSPDRKTQMLEAHFVMLLALKTCKLANLQVVIA